jgi:hypothetical protein
MPLISYVKIATNKQLLISESHGDSNRWTLCRGNLIHTTHTLPTPIHIHHSYASYELSPYMATFHADSTELDRFTALEKKCSRLHLLAQLSDLQDPPQFSLPNTTIKAVCLSQISVDEHATSVYWAHITGMWSVRSILAHGSNTSVLNRHRRGLQPWRCRFATSHSPTFPTDNPPLSTWRAPPGLRLTIQHYQLNKKGD